MNFKISSKFSIAIVITLFSVFSNGIESLLAQQSTQYEGIINEATNNDKKIIYLLGITKEKLGTNTMESLKYIEEAEKNIINCSDSIKFDFLMTAGEVFFYQNLFPEALQYFINGLDMQNSISPIEKIRALNSIGNVYSVTKQYDKAKEQYQKALKVYEHNSTYLSLNSLSMVYNNLGVLSKKEGKLVEASMFYEKAHKQRVLVNDTLGILEILQNMSNVHLELNNKAIAYEILQKALKLSNEFDNKLRRCNILSNIGSNYLDELKYDSAELYLLRAYKIAAEGYFPDIIEASTSGLIEIANEKNDFKNAYHYLKLNKEINDLLKDEENIREFTRIEFEYLYKEKKAEIKKQRIRREDRFYLGGVIFLLIFVILILLFFLQRKKTKQFKVEKEQVQENFDFSRKELSTTVMNLLQVTEIINETINKLLEIKEKLPDDIQSDLFQIVREMQQRNSKQNWKEFEIRFNQVNESFYKNLLFEYPDLSNNELRLCAFLKMNMSTKEISAITRQSNNSIMVARTRLRKKLGLVHNEVNFTQFLSTY